MASIDESTEQMTDEELGEKLRLSLGVHVAGLIAGHPVAAIGAVTGALSAMSDKDLQEIKQRRLLGPGVNKLIAKLIENPWGSGAETPQRAKGIKHLTGDATEDDVLPDGQEIDLTPYYMSGDFEDIWPGVELLTTDEAAKKLGIVRSTLHEWFKKGKVLKLSRQGKRGYRVPAELILGKNKIVPGLAQVIERIGHGSHNLAWGFLTDSVEFKDGFQRPLDLLKDGRVDEVLAQERRWGEQGGF